MLRSLVKDGSVRRQSLVVGGEIVGLQMGRNIVAMGMKIAPLSSRAGSLVKLR